MEQKQLSEKKSFPQKYKVQLYFCVPSCSHANHNGILYYSGCYLIQFSSTAATQKMFIFLYLFIPEKE